MKGFAKQPFVKYSNIINIDIKRHFVMLKNSTCNLLHAQLKWQNRNTNLWLGKQKNTVYTQYSHLWRVADGFEHQN